MNLVSGPLIWTGGSVSGTETTGQPAGVGMPQRHWVRAPLRLPSRNTLAVRDQVGVNSDFIFPQLRRVRSA